MNDNIVTRIDDYQANEKIELPYPHLFIPGSSDALPVVLGALAAGELPIIIRYNGTLLKVGNLRKSALTLSKLLKVFEFTVYLSSDKYYRIKNQCDILECSLWEE